VRNNALLEADACLDDRPDSPPPTMRVVHVCTTYTDSGGYVEALDDVSFCIERSEFLTILGPSGCGKSTLLRIMAGLLQPTGGGVYLEGKQLTCPTREIGFVFQAANLMPWRSVSRNMSLPLEVAGMPREEVAARVKDMIRLVGLTGFEDALPRHLSGGMQQRVAIARALVHDPRILMLDEPFAALDALTRERMNLELLRIWETQRKTVVMVTHNIQEAIFLSSRVLVMSPRPGRLVGQFQIPFAHPRRTEILYDASFVDLSRQIRDAIQATP
jgi:NitT/TauT family transport system ATP-binding protein